MALTQTHRTHPAGRFDRVVRYAALAALSLILILSPSLPATAADPSPRPEPSGAAFLETVWPEHPEWLAMLADILVKGNTIGGEDGWFRKAVAQTRFDWKQTRRALDRDGDGSISRDEFQGPSADFTRLDRDRDGTLTATDFDFATPAPGPSPGALVFGRADRDGNGKVTRQEFLALFDRADRDGLGFVSKDELQAAFEAPRMTLQQATSSAGGLTRWTFLKSFLRKELGPLPPGPALNDVAPDFTLRTAKGGEEVTLSRQVGPMPVVLVFGNVTCGPFRGQAGNLEKLAERYKGRARFLMVYVREAHPTDGWRMSTNDRVGVTIRQPRTFDERVEVAQVCDRSLGLGFPVLVDTIDDAVNDRYCGLPSRLYLIDRGGKIAYKSGRGPFGFKPDELEHSLILLLRQDASEPGATDAPAPGRDHSPRRKEADRDGRRD